jgi:transglutaminase superfamily protein/uncharacterized protein DUF4129
MRTSSRALPQRPLREAWLVPGIRRATLTSTIVGGAAIALSIARNPDAGKLDYAALGTVAVATALAIRFSARPQVRNSSIGVALLTATVLSGTLGFLACIHAAQFAAQRLSRDPRTWCWALGAGPAAAAIGLVLEPGAHWPFTFLAQLVLSLGAAPALGLAVRARWYDRRRPRELPPAVRARVAPATGWVLLPLIIAAAGVASLALDALPSPLGESWKPRPRAKPPRRDRSQAQRDALERQALEGLFPDEVRYGDDVVDFTGRPVMEVRVLRDGVQLGPQVGGLYLRGLALDRVGETRVRATTDGLRQLEDEDDGRRDGWVQLADDPELPYLELQVKQRPMRIGVGGSIALFAPAPLLAVEAPAVLHSADAMTALPDAPDGWFELRMRSYDWGSEELDLHPRHSQHPDPKTRRLPRDSAEMREIAALAARVCSAQLTDHQRVLAVKAHFAAYDYELITRDLPGVQGVVALFDRGSGHCTHFASATVLMLRSLGISSRIATGYLASNYDAELGGWLVSSRNGHAWVEVWFDGVGWVPFETTPMSRRARALDWTGDGSGLSAWAADLATDVELWAGSGGEARYLKLAFRTASDFPEAAWFSVRQRPLTAVALTLLAALVFLWRRRDRRVIERTERRVLPARISSRKLEQRWLADLAARGHRRAPHQTWREFVSAVEDADAALGERLRPIATAFETVAYAGRPLEDAEREAIEAQLVSLRGS